MSVIRRILVAVMLVITTLPALGMSLGTTREIFNQGKNYLIGDTIQPDSAVICFRKIIESYRPDLPEKQREICAAAASNLGFTYYQHLYDFKSAYESLLLAQEICGDINKPNIKADVKINLGDLYSKFSEYNGAPEFKTAAIDAYRDAFMTTYENGLYDLMLYSFCNLTALGQNLSQIEKEAGILDKFGSARIPEGTPLAKYSHLRYEALRTYLDGDKAKANVLLIQSINSVDDKLTPEVWYMQAIDLTSALYLERNMPDSAQFYVNKLLKSPEAEHSGTLRANAFKCLSDIYTHIGDEEHAWEAYVNLLKVQDSMMSLHKLDAVDNVKFVHDLAVERHESAAKLVESTRAEEICKLSIFFVGLVLIIAIPIFMVMIRRHRRLKAKYRELFNQRRHIMEQEDNNRKLREETLAKKSESKADPDVHPGALQVLTVLDNSVEIFDPDFSLERLSELTGIRPRTLSTILNEQLHLSFRDLLNQYRVREACRRLSDPASYGHFTIEAISHSVGYKSRTSLITAFKKETGLTPSEYQRQAAKK